MDVYETNTHPFILKIWREEVEEETGQTLWRGHITHVPTDHRRYVQSLDEIIDFIVPYLKQMGVVIE